MTDHRKGYFVAICGIDGSGKTTQVAEVAAYLGLERPVLTTRQPSDLYRQDPIVRTVLDLDNEDPLVLPEIGLLAAFDRYRHVREVVRPALKEGKAVVTDRYVYTGYAYMIARGLDPEWLRTVYRQLPPPDLTVFLDVPPDLAIERILVRDGSSKKREELDLERMSKVRAVFHEQPWGEVPNYYVLDGTQAPEAVTADIRKLVEAHDPG
jgi:dTMP kinase